MARYLGDTTLVPETVAILLGAIFVSNFVTVQFLGLCPFLGASRDFEGALGMGAATTFVLTLASAASFVVETYVLEPFDAQYLRIIVFIFVIAALVQGVGFVVRASAPVIHAGLGIFLPLITTNCAVLGVALLNVRNNTSFLDSVLFGLGAALGFSLVLVMFTCIRERLIDERIPRPLRGTAINLVTAGLMSLAFMGFVGL